MGTSTGRVVLGGVAQVRHSGPLQLRHDGGAAVLRIETAVRLLAQPLPLAWTSPNRDHARMLTRRVSLGLIVLGLLLALCPVKADGTRFDLALSSGGQSMSQLESRWADPAQRPWLGARPLCWPPLLAPFTYMQDSTLRRGCAGPNARSMSLAVLLLATGAGVAAAGVRAPSLSLRRKNS